MPALTRLEDFNPFYRVLVGSLGLKEINAKTQAQLLPV